MLKREIIYLMRDKLGILIKLIGLKMREKI